MFSLIVGLIGYKMEFEHLLYENDNLSEVSEGYYFNRSKFLSTNLPTSMINAQAGL